ncbi:MAG: acyltransferase family protein [Patescibacteria group bacterium]|nr:acyltransferase family protein [Patescibacteria group bacterium]
MKVFIHDPIQSTWIFATIFLVALIVSIRRKNPKHLFPVSLTQELKGFAVLAIVFSHIGYFLATDTRFLFPLSILAGVAVDMFFFLSGYGITTSVYIKKSTSILGFYHKRLPKLLAPFWIVLALLFLVSFLVLKETYSWQYIWHSFVGFFPSADIYKDLDSPLWYFTIIFAYYLLFPLVFSKKQPWIAMVALYGVGYAVTRMWRPEILSGVINLYYVHIFAFPFGVFMGWLLEKRHIMWRAFLEVANKRLDKLHFAQVRRSLKTIKKTSFFRTLSKHLKRTLRYFFMAILGLIVLYFSYYSGYENMDKVWIISAITMSAIVALFIVKRVEFRLFSLFGLYSYEAYLIHWPLMYHYDIFYKNLPAWLATALYLVVFIILGWCIKIISDFILQKTKLEK